MCIRDRLKETPRDYFGVFGSNALIRQDLSWIPHISFEDGVLRMASSIKDGVSDFYTAIR